MIVRLVDGSVHRFQFLPEGGDDVTLASRIEKAFQAHDLVLEISGRLLVIPRHSILSIELTPAPAKLVAINPPQINYVPLKQETAKLKLVPVDSHVVMTARTLDISFGD